jgi:hypothetical protein
MRSMAEALFSELVNKPKDTVAKLHGSRRLLLRRRDDEDLVLTTAARAEQDTEMVSATTRMFVALMQHDDAARTMLLDVIPEAFPWVRFLPREDVQAFLVELVSTLRAVDELGSSGPVVQVITEWRRTAEIYADPELLATLRQEGGDYGPVSAPAAHA